MSTEASRTVARAAVRDRMATLRLSNVALAAQAGVDPKTVNDFLSGKRWPQRPNRAAISAALGWPSTEIDRMEQGGGASASSELGPPGDDAPAIRLGSVVSASVRGGRDPDGRLLYVAQSERQGGSRVELRYWPADDSEVATTTDLIGVVGDTHRAADALERRQQARPTFGTGSKRERWQEVQPTAARPGTPAPEPEPEPDGNKDPGEVDPA